MSSILVNCGKCSTKMKISSCWQQSIANIILNDTKSIDYPLTVFDEVLKQITDLGKGIVGDNTIYMSNCYVHLNCSIRLLKRISCLVYPQKFEVAGSNINCC